jgi:hypothetical protein
MDDNLIEIVELTLSNAMLNQVENTSLMSAGLGLILKNVRVPHVMPYTAILNPKFRSSSFDIIGVVLIKAIN